MVEDAGFWRGRRVLVTGHTGFKGSWLSLWLLQLGAQVVGLGLSPTTRPSLFEAAGLGIEIENLVVDIRDRSAVTEIIRRVQPEIVFHLAAQALVRESYLRPVETFETNVMGTVHILEAVREESSVRSIVLATSDKVYGDRVGLEPHRENDALGGNDPYATSKAACELAIASYRRAFLAEQGVAITSIRAGNVIGGGDWAADRLIPDAIRAWSTGRTLQVRRPEAVRPWQHVLEPLRACLLLAERTLNDPSLAGAYNIGPSAKGGLSVRSVVRLAREEWGWGDIAYDAVPIGPHETDILAIDASKAQHKLGIENRWTVEKAVKCTVAWYRAFNSGSAARALCYADLAAYDEHERYAHGSRRT